MLYIHHDDSSEVSAMRGNLAITLERRFSYISVSLPGGYQFQTLNNQRLGVAKLMHGFHLHGF